MESGISSVFHKNIRILDWIDRAILYTREGNYMAAMEAVAEVTDDITAVADAIMKDHEYFSLVSVESIAEMLEGIVNAKQDQDYVLLADLLQLQLESFLCNVQNYIMEKEDLYLFEEAVYYHQLAILHDHLYDSSLFDQDFNEELNASKLLEEGYRIEFSSCGLMTLAAKDLSGTAHYLHTNHKISEEAFLLARSWKKENVNRYVVSGLGLGYHVLTLHELAPDALIEVYERDMNIIKLCCAFSKIEELLESGKVTVYYDKDGSGFAKRQTAIAADESVCIHYPSYLRYIPKEG